MGAVHRNGPHSIASVPCCASGRVDRDRELLDRRRERLRRHARHAEVVRAVVARAPLAGLLVHDQIRPLRCAAPSTACTCPPALMPASVIGADVVNCVAAFAPVRHT